MSGPLIVAIILAVAFIGYSIGLWKFAKSRHAAWLAVTILLSLPLLGMFVLCVCVGVVALAKGARELQRPTAATGASGSLAHKFDKVDGTQFNYSS